MRGERKSFGPYAFTLSSAEMEAAAARFGLRAALGGGLIARHLAPLAAFALVLVFASILALTGFISRRAGEATVLLAAAAFMIQRLAMHWRIRRARALGRSIIETLAAGGALSAGIDESGVAFESGGRSVSFGYADCEERRGRGRPRLCLAARWRPARPAGARPRRRRGGPARRHVRSRIVGARAPKGAATGASGGT